MVPIPAEFKGLARVFVNRCKAAHLAHNKLIDGLTDQLACRVAKFPDRGIPEWLLSDIARQWKQANDPFRLSVINNFKRSKGTFCEGRIAYKGLIHPQWEGSEPNIVIAFVSLNVVKHDVQISYRIDHLFSWHSIVRFYERSGMRRDEDLISEMIATLRIDPRDYEIGQDVSIRSWRGIIRFRTLNGNQVRMWTARTYVRND